MSKKTHPGETPAKHLGSFGKTEKNHSFGSFFPVQPVHAKAHTVPIHLLVLHICVLD